jgi:hypothetical protein
MEKDSEKLFRELKEELIGYVKLRSDLVKVNLYEKTSKAMSVLLINLLIIISGYFTLLFVSIMLGIALSHLLHSWLFGFGIITIVYIILFFTLAVFRRKQIQLYFTNTVAKILFNDLED